MSNTIFGAVTQLGYARDDLLIYTHTESPTRYEMAIKALETAVKPLGYTLTPIVTPSPDSGRAKEIGDVEPNPAEIAGLFFDHRN